MKIVYLNDDFPPDSIGGAAVIVDRLSRAFAKTDQVHIITTTRGQSKTTRSHNRTIHHLHSGYNLRFQAYLSLYNSQTVPPLKRLFQTLQPDVVHAHNVHAHLSYHALKLAREVGAKVVFTGHDSMPFFYGRLTDFVDTNADGIPDTPDLKVNPIRELIKNKLHFNPFRNPIIHHYLTTYPHHLVVVSKLLQKLFQTNGISTAQVIYNGIDPLAWKTLPQSKQIFRRRHHLRSFDSLLLVGRIRQDKGSHVAIDLLGKLPHARLLLAGPKDWGLEKALRYANRKHLTDSITYLGNLSQKQLATAYSSVNLVLASSLCFDSFPNSAIEAMASGAPVLVTPFSGTADLVTHNHDGFIANPFDQVHFTQTVRLALNDKQHLHQVAAKGLNLVKTKLTQKPWLDRHRRLYT